jgi:hypothetical protein
MSNEYSIDHGWFKSSYSNAGGSCIETRITSKFTIVRDSKDHRTESPTIKFLPATWQVFINVLGAKNS